MLLAPAQQKSAGATQRLSWWPQGISRRLELRAHGSARGIRDESEVTVTVLDDGVVDNGVRSDQAVECSSRTNQPTIPECLLEVQGMARSEVRKRGQQVLHILTESRTLRGISQRASVLQYLRRARHDEVLQSGKH